MVTSIARCVDCKDTGTRRQETPQSRWCLRYCDCAIGQALTASAIAMVDCGRRVVVRTTRTVKGYDIVARFDDGTPAGGAAVRTELDVPRHKVVLTRNRMVEALSGEFDNVRATPIPAVRA